MKGMDMTTKKRITLEDVSRAAGVSLSTASMVLSCRPGISFSEETVRKVRQAAEVLGYKGTQKRRPAHSGQKMVFIVSPNIGNAYYSTMIQAVQQEAARRGCTTLIFTTYRDAAKEEELLDLAVEQGAAGIIFTMMPCCVKRIENINRSIPIVVIGDRNSSFNVDTVELDNFSAGQLVGKHMLNMGHRHIAFISTTLNGVNAMRVRRLEGVQSIYAQEKDTSVEVFSREVSPQQELDDIGIERRIGYELTVEWLKKRGRISGIVAVNDSVAYGVLDALAEKGLRVPEDYSVCGFDNLSVSRLSGVGLTTVEHHIVEKGHHAFHILYERIQGGNTKNNITRIEFTHHLLVNRSTAPLKPTGENA